MDGDIEVPISARCPVSHAQSLIARTETSSRRYGDDLRILYEFIDPPLKGVGFQHNLSRLWIGLSLALAVLIIGTIAWSVSSRSVTETATVAKIKSTEPDHDMAPRQIVSPEVTAQYFRDNGVLGTDMSVAVILYRCHSSSNASSSREPESRKR